MGLLLGAEVDMQADGGGGEVQQETALLLGAGLFLKTVQKPLQAA
jgi:hypothetical protein